MPAPGEPQLAGFARRSLGEGPADSPRAVPQPATQWNCPGPAVPAPRARVGTCGDAPPLSPLQLAPAQAGIQTSLRKEQPGNCQLEGLTVTATGSHGTSNSSTCCLSLEPKGTTSGLSRLVRPVGWQNCGAHVSLASHMSISCTQGRTVRVVGGMEGESRGRCGRHPLSRSAFSSAWAVPVQVWLVSVPT